MFGLFKKKAKGFTLSLLELPSDGFCAVVGESHYQEALRATEGICSGGFEDRPDFTAALVPERDNPYDKNAIAVYSPEGKIGYLSRENALDFKNLFAEIGQRGFQGGACTAYLTGGESGKPLFGAVLRLADPHVCLASLFDNEEDWAGDHSASNASGAGDVRGRHFTEYVDDVRALRRSGREVEAETLLLELVDAREREARREGWGVAPWYYEQLAISYRKRGDVQSEIAVLERFARQQHAPGLKPSQLLERLAKARALAQRG